MESNENIESTEQLPVADDMIKSDDKKEILPVTPKKMRIVLWIILGMSILLVIVSIVLLVLKVINEPDLIINAPEKIESLEPSPSSLKDSSNLVSQRVVFEEEPYRNEELKFEINVPLGWNIDDSGVSDTALVLVNPQTSLDKDNVILTLVSVDVSEYSDLSLDDYAVNTKEGLVNSFENYKIEEYKRVVIGGVNYYVIGGSYTLEGQKIRNRNALLVFNNRGYAISAASPEETWSKIEILLNATIFSFRNY